ncbi:hypothetical protein EJB10_02195 [Wolbachia endosymbiont of Brugia malayi]|uniref:hypothetical protein n=1 Tax=Wolbachia endosymbiont of Brugia malayi TaxID=80849 RepID=UPI00004C9235|nr:hypothetical protein [Wolbachia endosymbiont of Brugia malayi]AAW70628.1 Predicted protein [Wolbachia endosymbiont strain TRS of Brugia malayi]QCB61615.1 hypothetical protein EJB10_02195 [Wolbachia endosymbiont of Brugia malayi]
MKEEKIPKNKQEQLGQPKIPVSSQVSNTQNNNQQPNLQSENGSKLPIAAASMLAITGIAFRGSYCSLPRNVSSRNSNRGLLSCCYYNPISL